MKLVVFRGGRKKSLNKKSGYDPDDFFYGYFYANSSDPTILFNEPKFGKNPFCRDLWKYSVGQFFDFFRIKFSLTQVLQFVNELIRANSIFTTTDSIGLPIVFLKKMGVICGDIHFLSQGLTNLYEERTLSPFLDKVNRFVCSRLLMTSDVNLHVLGEGAKDALHQYLINIRQKEVNCLQFGVDVDFWIPDSRVVSENYILSVGNDPARDFDLLIQSTDLPIKLVTAKSLPSKPNIERYSGISNIELRELYQKSRIVVIPLQDVSQPSGQSVALQAMSCGKAVLLSDTRGLWDRRGMKHDFNCRLVIPNNVKAFSEAIEYMWADQDYCNQLGHNARETVLELYASKTLGKHLSRILQSQAVVI